jgi:hypothetical protein
MKDKVCGLEMSNEAFCSGVLLFVGLLGAFRMRADVRRYGLHEHVLHIVARKNLPCTHPLAAYAASGISG